MSLAALPDRDDDSAAAAEALAAVGWCRMAAPWPTLLADCRAEALVLATRGTLQPAATGRGDGRQLTGVRGDSTLWLDDPACGEPARALLAALRELGRDLNRRLMLGMDEVEAHYALYPPGAGYARHRDRFRDDDARLLSLVLYLNPEWPADAGGELRLHLPDGAVDIAPGLGTMALFLSAEVEHEVLPAALPRLSVAAWFRRRA